MISQEPITTDTKHTEADDTRGQMNRMYRWTRHIYDASRKYYLLGRDTLIRRIKITEQDVVCEIGCGTARNLIKLAEKHPDFRFYGLDASDEMLKTAHSALKYTGLSSNVALVQGFAQSFEPQKLFALERPINKFIFSYSLSIIPPWKESIDHTLALLPAQGEIHIIDFGAQSGLPRFVRAIIFGWLKLFHVYYRPEIEAHLQTLKAQGKGTLKIHNLYRGYAFYAIFKKN
ncbi:MAG: class I SAM-dependent methyltransferase [Alphaproteobacteria bacterium]